MHSLPAAQKVGVVGLGYVGLPLAMALAKAGFAVTGVDSDPEKIASLEAGKPLLESVDPERLGMLVADGNLRPTHDYAALGEVETAIICLPTPLDEHREPDLSTVVSGAQAVSRNLAPGALVVLESTTYPGTTREVLLPILEGSSWRAGEDFYLAFSPERIDPGNSEHTVENTPRVVGGITGECTRRAVELYEEVAPEVYPVSTPESAEMSKLLENIFRGVNIALINELAMLCDRMDIDVWEVISAADTKPFGFMPFYPGPGLGGHCIPIDPFYLSWRARSFDMTTEFIELAGRINVNMPHYAVSKIAGALNSDKKPVNGSRVLLLGLSYKPNVGDLRESPSLDILRLLTEAGAEVAYHDPHVPYYGERGLSSVELTSGELRSADCVVIATDHEAIDLQMVVESSTTIVDLRNAVRRRLGSKLPANVDVL